MFRYSALRSVLDEPASRLVVAYSSGLDSHVLLHALVQASKNHAGKDIVAFHVNHGLSERAAEWQQHCESVCKALGIECFSAQVEVVGRNLENAARRARYQAFKEFLKSTDLLLLAHHREDQVETMLFRLFRGSGARSGMPVRRKLGAASLLRPLLRVPKSDLVRYANINSLEWREDESNQNQAFDRNFLRGKILPLIGSRWPGYGESVEKSLQRAEAHASLAADLAHIDLTAVRVGLSLDAERFLALPHLRRENLLRHWLADFGIGQPSEGQLGEIVRQLASAESDRYQVFSVGHAELRRWRNHVSLGIDINVTVPNQPLLYRLGEAIQIAGGNLTSARVAGAGICARRLADHRLQLRFRQGGERCHPAGRVGSHPLKKVFQELAVPPWLRSRYPLVYAQDELIAVAGLFVSEGWQALEEEEGWQLDWEPTQQRAPPRSEH